MGDDRINGDEAARIVEKSTAITEVSGDRGRVAAAAQRVGPGGKLSTSESIIAKEVENRTDRYKKFG